MRVDAVVRSAVMAMAGVGAVACIAQQAQPSPPSQPPEVSHASVSVRHGETPAAVVAGAAAPTWIGYRIVTLHPLRTNWNSDVEFLEGRPRESRDAQAESGPGSAVVLLRAANGKLERVQLQEPERKLDGGGLPFVWIDGVSAADSVAVLRAAVEAGNAAQQEQASATAETRTAVEARSLLHADNVVETALMAIAQHDAPQATEALKSFTEPKYATRTRERAAFWLANSRGRVGLDVVAGMLRSEKEDALREKLVFDLTLVHGEAEAAALDELLRLAKSDGSARVRGRAQFWLAQEAGRKQMADGRIVDALRDAVANDPEAAIRRSAVFAISRLPKEQAVPQLIQVASTSTDPQTRREAIVWLGRTDDPRAIAYLEKVVRQ